MVVCDRSNGFTTGGLESLETHVINSISKIFKLYHYVKQIVGPLGKVINW